MTAPVPAPAPALRDTLTDAIRFWERARILYNLVLLAIVTGYFIAGWPSSAGRLNADIALHIFLMAVAANVLFCAAYLPDVLAQLSGLRGTWLRVRWVLFVIGTATAAIITRFIAQAMFAV